MNRGIVINYENAIIRGARRGHDGRRCNCDWSGRLGRNGWQFDGECRALAGLAGYADVTAHDLAKLFRKRQAESSAAVATRSGIVGLSEGAEQFGHLLRGHADAGVFYAEDEPIGAVARFAAGGERHDAALRELAGVAEQVENALAHFDAVGLHRIDVL